jgi:hypothetical protein
MKECPECKEPYSDTDTICRRDGAGLVRIGRDSRKLVLGIGIAIGGFFVGGPVLAAAIAVGATLWWLLS